MWPALIQAGGALFAAWMANEGSTKATDAQLAGMDAATAEQARQFDTFLNLMGPAMASENNRRALADAFLGVPSTYQAPTASRQTGNPVAQQYRVGPQQPGFNYGDYSITNQVTGHNPSVMAAIAEGRNPLDPGDFTNLHNGLNKIIFGPERSKDNFSTWGTPQANAGNAGAGDWASYWDANPDVQHWGANLKTADPRGYDLLKKSYDVDASGDLSPGELAQAHYYSIAPKEDPRGKAGGGAIPTGGGNTQSTMPVGGVNLEGGTGATGNGLTQSGAFDIWKASPFFKAAQKGFDDDRNVIQGSAATGGQLLSGATLKALDDRQTSRAYQSAGDFYNALLGQPANTNTSQAAQGSINFGNSMANNALLRGDILGQNAQTQNANWMKGFDSVAGAIGKYGQQQGWLS